ncbi:hypothetical protein MUP01_12130 [Candidatus Bathyarchaeota archaeon]|nr:hypothetical protein [Candidatus Bathyarchaeota archaeon]
MNVNQKVEIMRVLFDCEKTGAAWSYIKAELERKYGEVNPNTLAFNLNQLMSIGLIEKRQLPDPMFVLKRRDEKT